MLSETPVALLPEVATNMFRHFMIIVLMLVLADRHVYADLIQTGSFNNWQSQVESFTTIDVNGWPSNTFITNQYQDIGVQFTNIVFIHNISSYIDGSGLVGLNGIRIEFHDPQYWIAVHFLGVVAFEFFYKGESIAITPHFGLTGTFVGTVSDLPFDEVYLFAPQPPFSSNVISVDNLHWGAPIPAPGVLGLFALAALGCKRRRR